MCSYKSTEISLLFIYRTRCFGSTTQTTRAIWKHCTSSEHKEHEVVMRLSVKSSPVMLQQLRSTNQEIPHCFTATCHSQISTIGSRIMFSLPCTWRCSMRAHWESSTRRTGYNFCSSSSPLISQRRPYISRFFVGSFGLKSCSNLAFKFVPFWIWSC